MSRFEEAFGGEEPREYGGGDEFFLGEEQEHAAAGDFGMFPETEVGRAGDVAPLGSQRASLPWNIEARSEVGRGE